MAIKNTISIVSGSFRLYYHPAVVIFLIHNVTTKGSACPISGFNISDVMKSEQVFLFLFSHNNQDI